MKTICTLIFTLILTNIFGQNVNILNKTELYPLDSNIWISLADNERIGDYTRNNSLVYCGKIYCYDKPLKDVDILSFKVLTRTNYAKDENNVYYFNEYNCNDNTDCPNCDCEIFIVKNANPDSFRHLRKSYATDGLRVFYHGLPIENADAETFKVIDGPKYLDFAIDKNNVYKYNKVFINADPFTFYYAKTDERNNETEYEPRYIVGDKDNLWEYFPTKDTILKLE